MWGPFGAPCETRFRLLLCCRGLVFGGWKDVVCLHPPMMFCPFRSWSVYHPAQISELSCLVYQAVESWRDYNFDEGVKDAGRLLAQGHESLPDELRVAQLKSTVSWMQMGECHDVPGTRQYDVRAVHV
ncbi:uncharacterized protein B0H18DRAFT_996154 [Fomitopsis serialis]|uniref:uncharacterized protein n=1 Tax=Fomitopsis serialis TaxID=139415 RepID=UPI0020085046|nr:uncharacterized protein B0H18DRAFT_996154 [Neoantrodia serialis]KAH9929766.1 hypothetical protein B0H18DRAFT_996154 [Neoantrodia serialis]